MSMTIFLISFVWLAALGALVCRMATRPDRVLESWERSPRLLKDNRDAFEDAIGAVLASKPATAQDMRDRAQKDLYVRP
jgi:hypothetical protein